MRSCWKIGIPVSHIELWTIRTLANSALVNSDPKKFGPSQFGPRPLVNSDPDHWSIRTLFYWSIRTSKRKILWSIRTFSLGQFGPFPLVNSDLFHCLVRTFELRIFLLENCVQIKNEHTGKAFSLLTDCLITGWLKANHPYMYIQALVFTCVVIFSSAFWVS